MFQSNPDGFELSRAETHDVFPDQAVRFVGSAPGNLHLPVLAVVAGQLQVPGRVGHFGTRGESEPVPYKWTKAGSERLLTSLRRPHCDQLVALVQLAETLGQNFDLVGGIGLQHRQLVGGLVAVGVHGRPRLRPHEPEEEKG